VTVHLTRQQDQFKLSDVIGYAGYLFSSSVLPLTTTYEAHHLTQTPNIEHNKENKGDNKRIHDLSILTLNDALTLSEQKPTTEKRQKNIE